LHKYTATKVSCRIFIQYFVFAVIGFYIGVQLAEAGKIGVIKEKLTCSVHFGQIGLKKKWRLTGKCT